MVTETVFKVYLPKQPFKCWRAQALAMLSDKRSGPSLLQSKFNGNDDTPAHGDFEFPIYCQIDFSLPPAVIYLPRLRELTLVET